METLECIKSRRSIRHFLDKEIPDNLVEQLLEAVRWAPSWANTQCWEVIVVKEQAMKEKIAEVMGQNYSTKAVIAAPVVMIMCAAKGKSGFNQGVPTTNKGDWFMFDLGIASQNLCLAAHALGLGTVHVGHFDHARMDQLLELPENIETVEIIPAGYPAREGTAPPRKELSEFVHMNHYSQAYQGH
ncbi:MAG TPA: nitroreductase family protein [Syntrophomonadaceae bacterium]|nr:nitroreductase family protein [Syntrophomonadaceae bacterium]